MNSTNQEASKSFLFSALGADLHPVRGMKDFCRGLPVLDSSVVYYRRGEPLIEGIRVLGREILVASMGVWQKYSGYLVPDPSWVSLQIPLRWTDEYIFDGRVVQPGEAILTNSPNGYASSGSDRVAVTIGFQKKALQRALRAVSGRPGDQFDFPRIYFRPSGRLVRLSRSVIRQTRWREADLPGAAYSLSLAEEARILDCAATDCLSAYRISGMAGEGSQQPADVVAVARDLVLSSRGNVPGIADLCAAAGVGQTRLYECFQQVQGMTPHQFLLGVRLYAAYERLTDTRNPPRSIKEVALDAGFSKSGHFAATFEKQFGELPSQLLESQTA